MTGLRLMSGGQETEGPQTTGPLRRCIVSGRHLPKEAMLRFVIGPEGGVVPDVNGRLPGRGFWLSAERDMIHTALEKNLFAKAARKRVSVSAGLADQAEGLLVRRCLDLIGMARRAGQVVAGFEKVKAMLRAGEAGVLLSAGDGAADGRSKLQALARGVAVISLFSSAELAAALGRDHVVHVAVASGRLADVLLSEAARLQGLGRQGAEPAKEKTRNRPKRLETD